MPEVIPWEGRRGQAIRDSETMQEKGSDIHNFAIVDAILGSYNGCISLCRNGVEIAREMAI